MSKKKHANQKLEQKSRAKLKNCFSGWIVNDIFQDFGLDMKIRFTESPDKIPVTPEISGNLSEDEEFTFSEKREVMPVSCFVQLKASKEFDGEEVAKKSLDTDWIKTYRKSSLPVVILLYEESSNEFYWEILQNFYQKNLRDDLDWFSQGKKQIEIPRENSFSAEEEEESNPVEIAKFANEVFRYRLKRVKKLHRRTAPGDAYEYLSTVEKKLQYYDNSIKSADAAISAAFDKLELEEEFSDSAAESHLLDAVRTLEIHFEGNVFETPKSGHSLLFDFLKVFNRVKKVARELGKEEIEGRIEKMERAIFSEIKGMEGLHYYNKEIEEKFRILRVDLNSLLPMFPEAWLEYEDGEAIDENLEAIAKNNEYQIVGFEFPRPIDKKCSQGQHEISDEQIRKVHRREINDKQVKCSKCDLSLDSLRTVFDEEWCSVCDVCGKIGEDFEFYMEMDTWICEDCSGKY